MELNERSGADEDEADAERQLALKHVTTSAARSIKVMAKFGAHAFRQRKDKSKEDCCLVELICLIEPSRGEGTNGCT